ncbi:hypothetical protein MMC25_006383 [Agyrium rufum]|nr:hypothetical protein [Agyrium rufum]
MEPIVFNEPPTQRVLRSTSGNASHVDNATSAGVKKEIKSPRKLRHAEIASALPSHRTSNSPDDHTAPSNTSLCIASGSQTRPAVFDRVKSTAIQHEGRKHHPLPPRPGQQRHWCNYEYYPVSIQYLTPATKKRPGKLVSLEIFKRRSLPAGTSPIDNGVIEWYLEPLKQEDIHGKTHIGWQRRQALLTDREYDKNYLGDTNSKYAQYCTRKRMHVGTDGKPVWDTDMEHAFQIAILEIKPIGKKKTKVWELQHGQHTERALGKNELISRRIKQLTGGSEWLLRVKYDERTDVTKNAIERSYDVCTGAFNVKYKQNDEPSHLSVKQGILRNSLNADGVDHGVKIDDIETPIVQRLNLTMDVTRETTPGDKASATVIHNFTQTQSEAGAQAKPLEGISQWRSRFPDLKDTWLSLFGNGCDLVNVETKILLKDAPKGSTLDARVEIDINCSRGYTDWRCQTRYYGSDGLVHQETSSLQQQYYSNHPKAHLEMTFGSRWWVKLFAEITKRRHIINLSGTPADLERHNAETRKMFRKTTVMSEILATNAAGNVHRLAVLLWRFDLVLPKEAATSTWRQLTVPTEVDTVVPPTWPSNNTTKPLSMFKLGIGFDPKTEEQYTLSTETKSQFGHQSALEHNDHCQHGRHLFSSAEVEHFHNSFSSAPPQTYTHLKLLGNEDMFHSVLDPSLTDWLGDDDLFQQAISGDPVHHHRSHVHVLPSNDHEQQHGPHPYGMQGLSEQRIDVDDPVEGALLDSFDSFAANDPNDRQIFMRFDADEAEAYAFSQEIMSTHQHIDHTLQAPNSSFDHFLDPAFRQEDNLTKHQHEDHIGCFQELQAVDEPQFRRDPSSCADGGSTISYMDHHQVYSVPPQESPYASPVPSSGLPANYHHDQVQRQDNHEVESQQAFFSQDAAQQASQLQESQHLDQVELDVMGGLEPDHSWETQLMPEMFHDDDLEARALELMNSEHFQLLESEDHVMVGSHNHDEYRVKIGLVVAQQEQKHNLADGEQVPGMAVEMSNALDKSQNVGDGDGDEWVVVKKEVQEEEEVLACEGRRPETGEALMEADA